MAAFPRPSLALEAPARAAGSAVAIQWLALPGAEQGLRWRLQRWGSLLPALCRPHRMRLGASAHFATRTTPTAELQRRFDELFDLRRPAACRTPYPFLYTQGVIDLLQARIFAALGADRRCLWLLRHRSRVLVPDPALLGRVVQDIDCSLARAVRVGPGEVLALLNTEIADPGGRVLASVEDAYLVHGLTMADAGQAEEDDLLRRSVSRMRRHTREIADGAEARRERMLYCSAATARRFARLAGGSPQSPYPSPGLRDGSGTRYREAPLAPMLLRHLLARELAEWGLDPRRLEIVFVAPAAAGQMLRLRQEGSRFELVDRHDRLLAFGRI